MNSVKQYGADPIAAFHESRMQFPVMRAAIGGDKTDHVFSGQKRRTLRHFIHHSQPFPDKAAAPGPDALAIAGERQVLTREAGPGKNAWRETLAAYIGYGAKSKGGAFMIGPKDSGFFGANVICPFFTEIGSQGVAYQTAARKEFQEWRAGVFLRQFGRQVRKTVLRGFAS